ncbi:hypothetical protein EDD80_101535 [Anseongella ginsenosidimutans]|uniref:PH (Pleckstrin Homology) domain-containing protein n=1 Tax=Anseongella ginsenosidimutans TaxID=496056 RepID=A0A4R3KXB9_9SPHI|nr:hypothetical protein [Anseongella ginsenosidimutans]QEC51013.1 hypothetical protein FRZ59_00700 [Anseongella ginsenosidimutans]TCS90335.1 hypothetical protein EDD80_101535 [Anseongella ginsenosidimutans]
MEENKYLFGEKQQFRQIWLWALLLAAVLPIPGVLIYQLITGQPAGDNPAPVTVLVILMLFVVLPLLLGFYYAKLTMRISREGIFFGWNFPSGALNRIAWPEIRECKIIQYKFVGLGYHVSMRYGTVYNVKGNLGLRIVKKDGTEYLIGTEKPDELQAALTEYYAGAILPGQAAVSGTGGAGGRKGI